MCRQPHVCIVPLAGVTLNPKTPKPLGKFELLLINSKKENKYNEENELIQNVAAKQRILSYVSNFKAYNYLF